MKKKIFLLLVVFVSVVFALLLSVCSHYGSYKRISLSAEMLGDAETMLETTIIKQTKVECSVSETYSDKMSVYKITPRVVTRVELQEMAEYLDIEGEIQDKKNRILINEGVGTPFTKVLTLRNENSLSYWSRNGGGTDAMTQTDTELESEAKAIFNALPLIEGEYEYLGVSSEQTVQEEEGDIIVTKRLSFRRLIDGIRVIGDDICDLYFNSNGLCNLEMKLCDYEKTGELDMLSLDEAVKKVKKPDAFVLDSETNQNFSGAADTLKIEKSKLLFVNQYSDGCEILQPVYNLMGTASNAGGSVEFSSRIIAIPKKYTYD